MPDTQNANSEFDYVVGSTLKLQRGSIIEVSFANRIIWGVVYECNYETEIEHSKLKPILSVSGDEVVVRPMMYLALSYDHRIIDGREAVSFLVRVKDSIEDPRRLLLDI